MKMETINKMNKKYHTIEDINLDLKKYLPRINSEFDLKFVWLSTNLTAIVGKNFALIIALDHFYADLWYAIRIKNEIVILDCDTYLSMRFDKDDIKGPFLEENVAGASIINDLKIIDNGIPNKWADLLNGDTEWLKDLKKSGQYNKIRLVKDEMDILERYL